MPISRRMDKEAVVNIRHVLARKIPRTEEPGGL